MSVITLPARCDRAAAEALLPEFVAAMGEGAIRIDATGVDAIGQSMLQLLVSARKTGDGAEIAPSPALQDTARLAGLTNALFDGAAQ